MLIEIRILHFERLLTMLEEQSSESGFGDTPSKSDAMPQMPDILYYTKHEVQKP
jgi:hypothetical protein